MDKQHYTGFPSALEEHRRPALNLHSLLAPRPLYTFFARHTGDAMVEANIFDDDLLVIGVPSARRLDTPKTLSSRRAEVTRWFPMGIAGTENLHLQTSGLGGERKNA